MANAGATIAREHPSLNRAGAGFSSCESPLAAGCQQQGSVRKGHHVRTTALSVGLAPALQSMLARCQSGGGEEGQGNEELMLELKLALTVHC